MNLDQALQTFIIEGRELLEAMEAALLRVADEADPAESINAIFRAAHTIKGSAGLFGLDSLVAFTHVVESLLDEVRGGEVVLDGPLTSLLLSCGDHIGGLIDLIDAGQPAGDPPLDPQRQATGEALLVRLHQHLAECAGQADAVAAPPAAAAGTALADLAPLAGAVQEGAEHWHVSLRLGANVLRNGMDPLSLLAYLGTLGRIETIVALHDAVPTLDDLDPEACCLGFEIALRSTADRASIAAAFEFVIDDCRLSLLPPHSPVTDFLALIAELPEAPARLTEVLLHCGSITAHELAAAQQGQPNPQPPASLPVEPGVAPAGDAAPGRPKPVKDGQASESQSVRVDADKLDRLIDLVGELIIAAASAELMGRRGRLVELQECHSTLCGLVEEVRDSALQLRMVKIGATFNRFKRVVHDVAQDLGKDIELRVSGVDTELDKTVVEKIGDPLMHLVRNAMDHGIDHPELRAARGKPAQGTVTLNAYHDSGSIVIEVSDDGSGLDRERILAKGVERGLVEAGRSLSDAEVYGLIFEPGFSTAQQVTSLSGRGVGMDVVKRNITALRGSVGISSQPGLGTTVTLRLPLTLSIINGLQVGVGPAVFVVPLDMVDECVAFSVEPGHDYTDLRGQVLPVISLRRLFSVGGVPAEHQNIVVVKHAGQKFGLVVDKLMGEAQTVIKPLAKMFAQVQGISGSSILGSGEVALILDVPVLLQKAQSPKGPIRAPDRLTLGV